MTWDVPVVYEDNHLLVVNKPAGLLTQGDSSGDQTLLDVAGEYIAHRYNKPGKVYLGLVHRLDRNVSGVVVLARTSKAAGRLSRQFRDGGVEKIYRAVLCGCPAAAAGELRSWLAAKGDRHGVTRAEPEAFDGSRDSLLRYTTLDTRGGEPGELPTVTTLVEVTPITGRRHQYGAPRRLPDHRVALHASRLTLKHPIGDRTMTWSVDYPADWPWPPAGPRRA
jgi:23S rRNA pseudouridine1911/1915/1917 synthase